MLVDRSEDLGSFRYEIIYHILFSKTNKRMNTTLNEKRLALLEETAAHYNSDNRCESGTSCVYSPTTVGLEGKTEGCAIGRKLPKELAIKFDEISKNNDDMGGVISHHSLFDLLPNELKDLGADFLTDLQQLHDLTWNWDATGLSSSGLEDVNNIKAKIKANEYDEPAN